MTASPQSADIWMMPGRASQRWWYGAREPTREGRSKYYRASGRKAALNVFDCEVAREIGVAMATTKPFKAAIVARRASKGRRGKRTPPEPRQYTVADLKRVKDRVEAAERRIANNHTSNPNRARAGLKRAQLELHVIKSQLRLRGLLE